MYETAGVERQSMVCHLVVDKNATDPAAEMFEDFKKLTKGMGADKLPPALKGKRLMDNDELKIVANSKGMLQIIINLDYRLPATWLRALSLSSARLIFSCENVATITGYSGFDPEVGINGIDLSNYPISRTFNFGINLNF